MHTAWSKLRSFGMRNLELSVPVSVGSAHMVSKHVDSVWAVLSHVN